MDPVLAVADLSVRFATPDGPLLAVNGVSLSVAAGETLGVVGESGSGKTQLFLAVMGLLAGNGRAVGSVRLGGRELLGLSPRELDALRGRHMTLVFQDSMTALNPYLKVGPQLTEVLERHLGLDRRAARVRAGAMLERVRIPDPVRRLEQYPHELSGGMRQRVMIAMALLCRPDVLIADEPTTALDVTVQAQILALLEELQEETGTAIVFITHDLAVVARLCDRVLVIYAGAVMESGAVEDIFYRPRHPYTAGLLAATPRLDEQVHGELITLPGQPPRLQELAPGCPFAPRCPYVFGRCRVETPRPRPVAGVPGQQRACHLEALP